MIDTFMSVGGDDAYFQYSDYSIPSFLKSNSKMNLHIFTTNTEYFQKYNNPYLKIYNYNIFKEHKDCQHIIKNLRKQHIHLPHYGHIMRQEYCATDVLMAQMILTNAKWVLKVDCDSYFVGNIFNIIIPQLTDNIDLYVVERKHPEMFLDCIKPGGGFILWNRKNKSIIQKYIKYFNGNVQSTLHNILLTNFSHKIFTHPGLHFVYPFTKNPNFNKQDAEKFLPAYFHVTGIDMLEQLKKLEEWFNEN